MKFGIKIVLFFELLIVLALTCPKLKAETADQWNAVYILGSYALTDGYMALGLKPFQAAGLTVLSATVKEVMDRFYQKNPSWWCRTGDRIFDKYYGFDYKDIIRAAIGASLKLTLNKISLKFYENQVYFQIKF